MRNYCMVMVGIDFGMGDGNLDLGLERTADGPQTPQGGDPLWDNIRSTDRSTKYYVGAYAKTVTTIKNVVFP